jgi:hypothetical protein
VPVSSGPVAVTFSTIASAGTTTVSKLTSAPSPPAGFRVGRPPIFYDIVTTATFAGGVTVCIDYSTSMVSNPSRVRLFHYQGGAWVNVTTSNDTVKRIICGNVTSLSPFGLFVPRGAAGHGGGGGDDDHDGDHGHSDHEHDDGHHDRD